MGGDYFMWFIYQVEAGSETRAAGHNRQHIINRRFRAVADPAGSDRQYLCAFGCHRSHVSKPRDLFNHVTLDREIEAGQERRQQQNGPKVSKFYVLIGNYPHYVL